MILPAVLYTHIYVRMTFSSLSIKYFSNKFHIVTMSLAPPPRERVSLLGRPLLHSDHSFDKHNPSVPARFDVCLLFNQVAKAGVIAPML